MCEFAWLLDCSSVGLLMCVCVVRMFAVDLRVCVFGMAWFGLFCFVFVCFVLCCLSACSCVGVFSCVCVFAVCAGSVDWLPVCVAFCACLSASAFVCVCLPVFLSFGLTVGRSV